MVVIHMLLVGGALALSVLVLGGVLLAAALTVADVVLDDVDGHDGRDW